MTKSSCPPLVVYKLSISPRQNFEMNCVIFPVQYIAKETSINKDTTRPNKPPTMMSGKFQGVISHRARGERRGRAVDVGVVEVGVVGLDGGWGGRPGLTMHHFVLGVKDNF